MRQNEIHFFNIKDKRFAYDINSTACAELDGLAFVILPELLSGSNDNLLEKHADNYSQTDIKNCINQCEGLLSTGMFGIEPNLYQHNLQHSLLGACLHISHNCNLNCEYCYAEAGSFTRKRELMNKKILLKAIDFVFRNSEDNEIIDIGFFGGEPLLNFKLICEGVKYARLRAKKLNKNVSFSMTSNATLLTDEIMNFISSENFSLIFSIDGPKEVHDRMRKKWSGEGSHQEVLKNLKHYMQHYSENFMVRGTFTNTTPHFSEQVLFLNDQGFKNVSVEPAQLHTSSPHSITTEDEIEKIKIEYDKLSEIYLERLEGNRPLNFFHFDYYLRNLISPHPMHTQCGAGGGFISITPDGKIFPCFEAVVENENCIGHIEHGFDEKRRMKFQGIHADARKGCSACWLKYFCGGGCNAFNIRYNQNINVPYQPYCEFMKHRFKLSAWILTKTMEKGENAVRRLKKHLEIDS